MCSLVSQIRIYDYSSLPILTKVYGKNDEYVCCAVKVMFQSASCHMNKNAMALCILFVFKFIQLGWNMRSEFAKHDLFADLCFDVSCIKFYIRYFKKIIPERNLLITQLSKKVTPRSITKDFIPITKQVIVHLKNWIILNWITEGMIFCTDMFQFNEVLLYWYCLDCKTSVIYNFGS